VLVKFVPYDARMLPLRDNVPTRTFPVVTVALIAANFAVWFWELSVPAGKVDEYAYYPCSVDGPCVGSAVDHLPSWGGALTSMFMHASWAHILGNMLFLWIFGNNVEDALGRVRFLVFYLAAGYTATAVQTVVTLHWGNATDASIPNVGASGAIAGVLGAYLILLPHASVLTLFGFFLIPVPAVFFLGFWFLFQLWEGGASITQPQSGGGVAFFAHVGGFVFGALTVHLFAVKTPARPAW
jgi:membrane associated rhomboid family serine protease